MTYQEAVALYSECEKFLETSTLPADSPVRAMLRENSRRCKSVKDEPR